MEQLSDKRLIVRLEEVDSTNNYLKSMVREKQPEEGSVVMADFQTSGRGQMGNGWYSERGKNLLFSLLIYPDSLLANKQFIISRIVSLAIKNVLDRYSDNFRIKWPNDIYWKDKKIAGMLIENNVLGRYIQNCVIGVGININQEIFPDELPNPVSLKQIIGFEQDKDCILELFLKSFFLLYRKFQKGDVGTIEDEYMIDLYRVNDYYWFSDAAGRFRAKIKEVQPSGHLVLETAEDGEERVYAFKEVAFEEL